MSFAKLYSQLQKRRAAPTAPGSDWNNSGSIIAGMGETAGRAGTMGQEATSSYFDDLKNFNPTEAINKYAQGTWGAMKGGPGGFDDTLESLKGSSVRGGRLDTGFFDADVGDLYRKTTNDFGNAMARTSVEGARMDMDNTAAMGDFGAEQTDLNLTLGAGRASQLINEAREKAERRRKKKRGIGGLIGGAVGGVGGFMLGGPAGAFEGYKLGTAAGGGF